MERKEVTIVIYDCETDGNNVKNTKTLSYDKGYIYDDCDNIICENGFDIETDEMFFVSDVVAVNFNEIVEHYKDFNNVDIRDLDFDIVY